MPRATPMSPVHLHRLPLPLSESVKEEDAVAKTTVTLLACDRCRAETGEDIEANESVAFGYDGYRYTLDLCPPHAEGSMPPCRP